MNDNHIIVTGDQVQVGPMLAHMMLASQDLQDKLLSLAGQDEEIPEMHFPVAETGGVLTLELKLIAGLPILTVCYIDETYTAEYQHIGGDSIETLEMSFDEERNIIDWLEDNLDTSASYSQEETLPFADRFGEYLRVKVTDIEAKPNNDGGWTATGDVWTAHYAEDIQREAEAARKAA